MKINAMFVSALAVVAASASANVVLFSEDFEDVSPLNRPVDEIGKAGGIYDGQNVWTTNPSMGLPGWSFQTSATTANGADEWAGWSFANKNFWAAVAGDQRRTEFNLASGNVAVADPDEYDDYQGGIGGLQGQRYNAFMKTGAIDLSQAVPGTAMLKFASSWRPEGFDDLDGLNNQTATITAYFDGSSTGVEILRWDSDEGIPGILPPSPFYKADATNEMVMLNLDTTGRQSVQLEFALTNAANDWWWAVDNIEVSATAVPEPGTMAVLGLGALAFLRRRRSK